MVGYEKVQHVRVLGHQNRISQAISKFGQDVFPLRVRG
jgi:hypothetical protein